MPHSEIHTPCHRPVPCISSRLVLFLFQAIYQFSTASQRDPQLLLVFLEISQIFVAFYFIFDATFSEAN